jgi:hypothetical protein
MFKSLLKDKQVASQAQKEGGYLPPQKKNFSSRRLNQLGKKLAAKTYLEIGVHEGSTFFNTNFATKHAVDPHFKFDTSEFENKKTKFFSMPSDDYFREHADGLKFDLVFLDGLHTFEQTFRDFCSALTLTHDRSVILLDDTYPSDIYSAWPKPDDVARARQVTGDESRLWHGDIYKMVFAIHDFFPMLSYATINTRGNPQTLVWRQARRDFRPLMNNLEAISRMTWFDLQRHLETMAFVEEEAGIERVVTALSGR